MPSTVSIDSRGYGRIYKTVMRNRQLPLLAKALYAYFCSYAGNGYQAYPKRDKTVRDLNINKDTYTKHLAPLVSGGYIVKERTAAGNVYTIMRTVPGYDSSTQADNDMTDMLVMENVSAKGFGTVPKIVMLDTRLTAQAKAIYAYFASFAGAGTTAFPRRATIMRDLGLSPVTYYKHYNLLINLGYLSVERRKTSGKYDVSLYRLTDCVDAPTIAPSPPKSKKGKQKAMSEKLSHGKNGFVIGNNSGKGEAAEPMSEKLSHGEMLKTPAPMSEKPLSEKLSSEKMVCGNFGHRNINNNSTTNNSLEKEQGKYHQDSVPDDKKPVPLLSLEQAKEIMRYDYWRREAQAWGELKERLGHFTVTGDKAHYARRTNEILDEIAHQIQELLNNEQESDRVAAMLDSEAFAEFFDMVLTHWDEIRSAKGYVKASLRNLERGMDIKRYSPICDQSAAKKPAHSC